MEKVSYFKNIKCEKCGNRLLSVYVRGKFKDKLNFKSLENYYYCEKCKKIYMFNDSNKIVIKE